MSSKFKIDPKDVSQVVQGKSFLAELGGIRFIWTIHDFQDSVELGLTIKSPSFEIKTTDPSVNVHLFHLEMEIPKKDPNNDGIVFPVFLVNETGGDILMKIALLDFSLSYKELFMPCVSVSLNANVVVQTPSNVRKMIMSVTPSIFTEEVNIAIKITLVQAVKQIVP